MPFEKELAVALDAARAAADLILDDYAGRTATADAPVTVSTTTDRDSQELILGRILASFPSDGLCAEEATPTLTAPSATTNRDRYWVVDPIDGTRGFVTKNGEFSVMIALVEAGLLVVGVVGEPARDRITYAVRGAGCHVLAGGLGPRPCRVTTTAQLQQAVFTQSHSKRGQPPSQAVARLAPPQVLETYSIGVKMGLIARGEVDYFVNSHPAFHDWDVAAGQILVEEAGGQVTTLTGEPISYRASTGLRQGGLVASNGALHGTILAGLTV
jgi:3'(2'), 5'-bisphosphate nucleotidase